jgi:hypothetical protein
MLKTKLYLFVLMMSLPLWSYEIPDENEVTAQSCKISLKVEVVRDESMERPTARAIVTGHLFDENGFPLVGERIEFSATTGSFSCRLPDDSTAAPLTDDNADVCFDTDVEGNAKPYLLNIPYNSRVQIRAKYTCGEQSIFATASMSVSRQVVKHKKAVRLP